MPRLSGPKHTFAEKLLMKQVAEVFTRKKKELGAGAAAKQLAVSLASFYKYAAGSDLPRLEVLKAAQEKWSVKWDLIDTSMVVRKHKPVSAEQLVLPLIRSMRQEDIEVIEVGASKDSCLRVILKIRFGAEVIST